jgi:hypothetical protein
MPAPSLASRASARVFPSSSRSEISTGQLSTAVIAAHLLPMLVLLCRGSR